MSNFSEGPWHLNLTTLDGEPVAWEVVGRVHGSAKPIIVGRVKFEKGKYVPSSLMDANLISASLEIYEALKAAVESCGDHDPVWLEDAIYALKKAEGNLNA